MVSVNPTVTTAHRPHRSFFLEWAMVNTKSPNWSERREQTAVEAQSQLNTLPGKVQATSWNGGRNIVRARGQGGVRQNRVLGS